MGIFFKISDNELLEMRKKIFIEKGLPPLNKNKFQKSPFSTSWFGRNNLGDYTYELCRFSSQMYLEIITVHISKGDNWIKVFLNIFQLTDKLESLDELQGIDGLQFCLPPNSKTEMRLRVDDFKGMPLLNFVKHRIGSYNSQGSLEKRRTQLGNLIEKDLTDIDYFIKRWHEMYLPLITTKEGHQIK